LNTPAAAAAAVAAAAAAAAAAKITSFPRSLHSACLLQLFTSATPESQTSSRHERRLVNFCQRNRHKINESTEF